MKKSIPEMSIDTRLILQKLLEAKIGDMLTYEELSEIISRDVQHEARSCLMSAMRSAIGHDIVFGTVRGEGIKRLTDAELSGIGDGARQHISRTAKRAMRKMSVVGDFGALTNDQKIRHNMSVSMLGAMAHLASPKQVKALENKVSVGMEALSIQKTLESFMGK